MDHCIWVLIPLAVYVIIKRANNVSGTVAISKGGNRALLEVSIGLAIVARRDLFSLRSSGADLPHEYDGELLSLIRRGEELSERNQNLKKASDVKVLEREVNALFESVLGLVAAIEGGNK